MLYVMLVLMTMIGSVASFFLKRASQSESLLRTLGNYNLYLGGGLYLLSALLNIYLLRFLDYSVVLPMTSLTYVWTMFLSSRLLGERVTNRKLAGVALIVAGSVLVSL